MPAALTAPRHLLEHSTDSTLRHIERWELSPGVGHVLRINKAVHKRSLLSDILFASTEKFDSEGHLQATNWQKDSSHASPESGSSTHGIRVPPHVIVSGAVCGHHQLMTACALPPTY